MIAPTIAMMKEQAKSKRALETAMRLAYADLLAGHISDIAQWQEVHRVLPGESMAILIMAIVQANAKDVAQTLLALTQSPAHLFMMLGDGYRFDEATKTAVFTSVESAVVFGRQFPGWTVSGSKHW
ncbi:MAG: hypothetical protein KDE47_04780 [Caldilineaceae bacterium]|nr:hypothetical protein [Caldilineaceae bacterium]